MLTRAARSASRTARATAAANVSGSGVSAQADGHWLDVQVHDTGVGIASEAFEHIFERFYRADASRHADDLHAGLGLSIVKGYVGLLGGTISVESRVGQGTTFRVRLPATGQAA